MRYTLQSSEIFMVTSSRNVQLSLMQLFVECKGITWQACNMFVSFQFLIEEKWTIGDKYVKLCKNMDHKYVAILC